MRVLRIYHGGRNQAHRERELALLSHADVTLVVPSQWPEATPEANLQSQPFRIIELDVRRSGDVNRHSYPDQAVLLRVLGEVKPDILDIHEEPVSLAVRQWLAAAAGTLPAVAYTAQNVDKRFPPPFAQHEQDAYRSLSALYPCSAQAASVTRGKGFAGLLDVLPLGYDETLLYPGSQSLDDSELVLALFGRLVPEKGVLDAVRALAALSNVRPARLVVCGSGPDEPRARALAASLGISHCVDVESWKPMNELAGLYRSTHVLLIPSRPTETWVEQFGRVIVEAQASGAVVAGYDSGTIREVGGEAALLVEPGDVDSLAASITSLVLDPEDFDHRRTLGLDASKARTWSRVAEQQAELYRRVLDNSEERLELPRSPSRRRAVARAEFGRTASTTAGQRPFALPYLRAGGRGPAALAAAIDTAAELKARLSSAR